MASSPSQTPTSQAAGATTGTAAAMTAPGSVPEASHPPGPPDEPEMTGDRYDGRHLVYGEGSSGAPAWRDASGR